MDNEFKREIILDNYDHPFNKVDEELNGYIKVNSANDSCIDNINLYIKKKELLMILVGNLKFYQIVELLITMQLQKVIVRHLLKVVGTRKDIFKKIHLKMMNLL